MGKETECQENYTQPQKEMQKMKLLLSSECSLWCQCRTDAHESYGGGDPLGASERSLWCQADTCTPMGLWLECKLSRTAFYCNLKTLDITATRIYMQVFGERDSKDA